MPLLCATVLPACEESSAEGRGKPGRSTRLQGLTECETILS